MENKLKAIDVLRFTPYDKLYRVGNEMEAESFFKENLRVVTASFSDQLKDFREYLNPSSNGFFPYVLFSGYSGCGKTTMLHYFRDVLENEGRNQFRIVNLTDKSVASGSAIDLLINSVKEYLFEILLDGNFLSIQIIRKIFVKISFEKELDRTEYLYKIKSLILLNSQLSREGNDSNESNLEMDATENYFEMVREFLDFLPFETLLMTYLIELYARYFELIDSTCDPFSEDPSSCLVIVFDNLDEIDLQNVTKGFWNILEDSRRRASFALARYNHNIGALPLYHNVSIILSVRESNISPKHSQLRDLLGPFCVGVRIILDGEVAEIVQKRLDYIHRKNLWTAEDAPYKALIEIFNADSAWIRKAIFPLFNFDYRQYLKLPSGILRNPSGGQSSDQIPSVEAYLNVKACNVAISRGVLFCYLIQYAFDTYFRRFTHEISKGCNPYRMLLTVMFNLSYPDGLSEDEEEKIRRRPKNFFLKDLLGITSGVFSLEQTVKWVTDFFPTDQASFAQWVLIYNADLEKLRGILREYPQLINKEDRKITLNDKKILSEIEDTEIRFNASAYSYLRHIVTHWEYFSYLDRRQKAKAGAKRSKGRNDIPLALLTQVDFVSDGNTAKKGSRLNDSGNNTNVPSFRFESKIDDVFRIVSRKRTSVGAYYRNVFQGKYPTESEFSDSVFAFGESHEKKSFYITKVLFTHVSYLDNFRYFAWNCPLFRAELESHRNTYKSLKSHVKIQDFILSRIEMYLRECRKVNYRDARYEEQIQKMEHKILEIRKLINLDADEFLMPTSSSVNNPQWIYVNADD